MPSMVLGCAPEERRNRMKYATCVCVFALTQLYQYTTSLYLFASSLNVEIEHTPYGFLFTCIGMKISKMKEKRLFACPYKWYPLYTPRKKAYSYGLFLSLIFPVHRCQAQSFNVYKTMQHEKQNRGISEFSKQTQDE